MNATSLQSRLILIGAAMMMTVAMGMRQSLGLFMGPVTHDLALTAADFTFAVAIQNISWGASQAFVGAFADKHGTRPVMMAGAAGYAFGLVVMLMAHSLSMLAISGVLIGVALSCVASSLAMSVSARAVPESRRSATLGLVSAFGSLGTLLIAPLAQAVVGGLGWHFGIVLFIAITAAIMLPAAFLAGGADKLPARSGDSVPMKAVLGQAARHRGFIVMSAAYFVCGLQLVFLTTHLPAYLAICGMDPMLSAEALATIGGVNCFGSWLFGWLGGRYPKHILLGLLYILRSIALFAFFVAPPTPTTTLAFAAAMGMLWMGVMPLTSGMVAEMFGTRYMATLLGISFMVHQAGSFLGAWGGGLIYDALGSYDRAWQIGVTIGVIAGLVQIAAGGPSRPRDRLVGPALAPG